MERIMPREPAASPGIFVCKSAASCGNGVRKSRIEFSQPGERRDHKEAAANFFADVRQLSEEVSLATRVPVAVADALKVSSRLQSEPGYRRFERQSSVPSINRVCRTHCC